MKFDFTLKMLGWGISTIIKKDIPDKKTLKEIKYEYRAILERASDIGSKNTLITSYALAAYFIAMNRKTAFSPEELIAILDRNMRNSKMIKTMMGNADGYFSEKKMQSRRQWSEVTHDKKYKNDWVVDVVEGDGDFRFGLDYLECGVCKLCKDEGCFELAKYLCKLDFMLVEVIGIKLKRTGTLADGCDRCDFRFYENN